MTSDNGSKPGPIRSLGMTVWMRVKFAVSARFQRCLLVRLPFLAPKCSASRESQRLPFFCCRSAMAGGGFHLIMRFALSCCLSIACSGPFLSVRLWKSVFPWDSVLECCVCRCLCENACAWYGCAIASCMCVTARSGMEEVPGRIFHRLSTGAAPF
jgi:hypothetical protein